MVLSKHITNITQNCLYVPFLLANLEREKTPFCVYVDRLAILKKVGVHVSLAQT